VDKPMEFVNILGDPARPVEERRGALRFVFHLVGDLHVRGLGDHPSIRQPQFSPVQE
jgi:hypothetical protein